MKISIDGGALCSTEQYGNYTLSNNLLFALNIYDSKNQYIVYLYNNPLHLQKIESNNIHYQTLRPKWGWLKLRVTIQEILYRTQIFLALNQALPVCTPAKKLVYSHGLSFKFFPDLYRSDHERLESQLSDYVNRADIVVVSSVKIKNEFMELGICDSNKLVINPYALPFVYHNYTKRKRQRFLLTVSSNHPIKNIGAVVKIFNYLRQDKRFSEIKLVLCGPHINYRNQNIIVINKPTIYQLKNLYQTAFAFLSTSFYESFNFPIIEALSQGCPVIAFSSAVIPELRKNVLIVKNIEDALEKLKILLNSGNEPIVDRQSVVNKFSWKRHVNSLINLYKQLV